MTREQYIEELRQRLSGLPASEREEALNYYIEYLEDAGDKSMEEIISELGTPQKVADKILSELPQEIQPTERKADWGNYQAPRQEVVSQKKHGKFWKILLIILGVLLLLAVLTFIAGGVFFKLITTNAVSVTDIENRSEVVGVTVLDSSEIQHSGGTIPLGETNISSVEAFDIASILVIRQGESWDLSYDLSRPEKLRAEIKKDDGENVLEIRYPSKTGKKPLDDERITLTVPEDVVLDSLELENCLANISVAGISMKDLSLESSVAKVYLQDIKVSEDMDIEAMAGSVSMRNVETAEFSAESNIGKIQGKDMTVTRKLDVESSLGEVILEGSFPCDMEFESNTGSVTIKAKGTAQEDYNYDISDSIGKVEIGSLDSAGIGSNYQANNGKAATIKSEDNIGKLTIDFE